MAAVSLAGLAETEVRALHDFFVRWFGPGPAPAIAQFEAGFHLEFEMMTPAGRVLDRAAVLSGLRAARASEPEGFSIEIMEVRPIWQGDDAVLLGYAEAQYRAGHETRRRSSALFLKDASAPRGVLWRHLQETWQAAPEGSRLRA